MNRLKDKERKGDSSDSEEEKRPPQTPPLADTSG
jgi:hypothetical protein